MSTVTVELLEQLVKATAEAQEAVKEAHAARKDLRATMREAEAIKGKIAELLREGINDLAVAETKRLFAEVGVDRIGASLQRSLDKWTELLVDGEDVLRQLEKHAIKVGALPA